MEILAADGCSVIQIIFRLQIITHDQQDNMTLERMQPNLQLQTALCVSGPSDGLKEAGLFTEIEEVAGVGMHDGVDQVQGVRQGQSAFFDQFGQCQGDIRAGDYGVARGVCDASGEEAVCRIPDGCRSVPAVLGECRSCGALVRHISGGCQSRP
jgi:hypothetical protein